MSSKDESHSKVFPDLQDFARNHKVSLDSKPPQFLHIHQMLCNYNNPKQTNKKKPIKMLQKEMQISSKMAKWEVHKMQKESNPYTVFEAPFPKISLYCKKQQNPTSEKGKQKKRQAQKMKTREKANYSAISASGINFNKFRAIKLKI